MSFDGPSSCCGTAAAAADAEKSWPDTNSGSQVEEGGGRDQIAFPIERGGLCGVVFMQRRRTSIRFAYDERDTDRTTKQNMSRGTRSSSSSEEEQSVTPLQSTSDSLLF